jgi:hypothetical protein
MTARVTLFNKHGQALTTPAMEITLGPHKNHAFNVADWIVDHDGFEEGSLVVFFHGLAMALGAQEIITDAAHGLNFDVHLTAYDDFESPRVEGLWWALDHQSEAKVFFANTKTSHTRVTPFYYVSGTEYRGDSVDLDGHESSSIDIEKELKELHVPGNITVGGITLKYTNGEGAIAVVGVIANKQTGFSTTMRFIDAASQKTTTLHGANLPIGKAQSDSGFPSNTRFTPHVIVRNNTEQTVQIHARIRYTLYDQPNVINLGSMSISGNQVRELDLTSAINAIGNHPVADTGIEIEHNRHPGAIMAYAAGVDHSGNKAFDVPIKDPKAMNFLGGSYPWNIAGDNHAVLHVKSIDAPTDGQKRQFMVKLYFDGGEYNLPLQQIEAGQTSEVDIKKLRDDQVKDALGHVIPLTVTGGQLAWYGRANKGEFIGRLAAYDPVAGTSSSFSCPQNCICTSGFLSASMTPGVIDGFADDTFSLTALETDGDCNLANQFTYEIYGAEFLSSNTDVIAISGQTATLVDQGTADITVNWDAFTVDRECTALASDGECVDARCPTNAVATPEDDTGGQSKRKPNDLLMGNDIITSNSTTCGGIRRLVDYVVVDNHTPARSVPSVQLVEDPASGITDSCNNISVTRTSTCSSVVDSAGIFEDDLVASCPGSGSCGFDVPHNKWQWCNGAAHVTLADLNYSVHHNQVKINDQATAYDGGTPFFP